MNVDPAHSALVVIDMNLWGAHPDYAMAGFLKDLGVDAARYWSRVEDQVVPAIARLLAVFRGAGAKVIYTEAGSFFSDGADTQPHMRDLYLSTNALDAQPDCRTRTELAPLPGEAVLVKPSSSAWTSTPIDFLLRQADIRSILFTGVVTNGCVMMSALGAWDHGFDVHVVEDATAAFDDHQHAVALEVFTMLGLGVQSAAEVEKAIVG